jgi:hypothetical protein
VELEGLVLIGRQACMMSPGFAIGRSQASHVSSWPGPPHMRGLSYGSRRSASFCRMR